MGRKYRAYSDMNQIVYIRFMGQIKWAYLDLNLIRYIYAVYDPFEMTNQGPILISGLARTRNTIPPMIFIFSRESERSVNFNHKAKFQIPFNPSSP